MKQTFTKQERLYEKKLMHQLFKGGNSFFVFPFKVFYVVLDQAAPYPAKVLISVPKRNFKRAVDRNRIKRLVREAYRKNKALLLSPGKDSEKPNRTYLIGLIYTPKVHMDYAEIERKIILILQQLQKKR